MRAEDAGGDAEGEGAERRARPDALALIQTEGQDERDEDVDRPYDGVCAERRAEERQLLRLAGKEKLAGQAANIGGMVEKPRTLDLDEILKMSPLEERVYKFRCVEAWAMIVPWTGFPLGKLIERVSPRPEAKFVRFITFNRPDQAPGMAAQGGEPTMPPRPARPAGPP